MSDSPLDAAPADGLEHAFSIPDHIQTDERLVTLHAEMVQRLRREAAGLPMNTIQQLLIERIASFYVQIKYKENTNTFTANQQKEYNSYWLQLTTEFNRLLQASDDKLREALLIEIQKIVGQAIDLITNPEDRKTVRRTLQEGFASIGQ